MRLGRSTLLLAFLFPAFIASAQRGEPVFIYSTDSTVFSGVVVAVDDSVLITDISGTPWKNGVAPASIRLKTFAVDQIAFVFREGQSRTRQGAWIGLGGGVVFSALYLTTALDNGTATSLRNAFRPFLVLVILPVSAGLGAIVGCCASRAELHIVPSTPEGYLALCELAIYGDRVPPALRATLRPATVEHYP